MQTDAVSVSSRADGETHNESNMVAKPVPVPPTVSSNDATSSHAAHTSVADEMGCKKMLGEILSRIIGIEAILHGRDGAREEKRRRMVDDMKEDIARRRLGRYHSRLAYGGS